jgi:PKD repeat protein
VAWSWDFGDGGSSGDRNPSHAFPASGTYEVALTATDNAGASETTDHQVNVTAPPPPNQSPTAGFTPPSCTTGQPCQFNDGSSDADGTITSWSWEFGDEKGSNQQNPVTTYDVSGIYNVTLTVTDDDGATDSETGQVTVTDPPPAEVRMLNLRRQPPPQTTSGSELDPGPEVELLSSTEGEIEEEDVPISVIVASGQGFLGGDTSEDTDDDGRADFEDLIVTGDPGSSITLRFTAPGYASVDSQPILIQ